MGMTKTVTLREPWDVDRRLAELSLKRELLLKVRAMAIGAGADATAFHAANAAGTYQYHAGTWGLRNEFVGDVWQLDRPDGVEAIRNDAAKVKVVFANVDLACNDEHDPKPRSRKGSGAERVCSGNLFGSLPKFAPKQTDKYAIYFLMVDDNGAAELSRPVVKNSTFTTPIERIYLSDGSDLDRTLLLTDDEDVASGFDPQVARK